MPISRRDFLEGAAALCVAQTLPSAQIGGTENDELWYAQPAEQWLEALPLGNGKLGAMVFGGVLQERIALSDSTAWSGAPQADQVNPGALGHLHEIRDLWFRGQYEAAQQLSARYLVGNMRNFGTNLPLPDVRMTCTNDVTRAEYRRSLDLRKAVASVQWHGSNGIFRREAFASHADNVLVVRQTCSKAASASLRIEFGRGVFPGSVDVLDDRTLAFRGRAWDTRHSSGHDGVEVAVWIRALHRGGSILRHPNALEIQGADAITLLIATGTSFDGCDAQRECQIAIGKAEAKSYDQLLRAHIADYQPLYTRVSIDLGRTAQTVRALATDERRSRLARGEDDPELLALFFKYGRYLTIAGSRSDSPLPLALQGIWNDGLASSMGWTDDFHLDINTQQNYWAAEVCNLSECQWPLFRMMDTMRAYGASTAGLMYGAPGWVAHTVTNPWGYTAPGGMGWGIFVTAGLWISLQLWQHWTFTRDPAFLRERAYPVLASAADFILTYMVRDPKKGWLVTGPSESPENWYITPLGNRASISMGCTCDRVLVHGLFSMCIEASQILQVDLPKRRQWETARAALPPFQVGRYGQLQEWLLDFEEAYPNHRHTSHLIALYPENQISPRTTPELARAAEVTINRRINAPHWEQSEWGRANIVAYYARLLKPEDAFHALTGLVSFSAAANLLTFSAGGVAGAQQSIFALDGNTAGSAAIAEMLLQSQSDELDLLPALPSAWPTGSFRGLCARGGFVVDIQWARGVLISAMIHSRQGGLAIVRYRGNTVRLMLQPGESRHLAAQLFSETTTHNATNPITPKEM